MARVARAKNFEPITARRQEAAAVDTSGKGNETAPDLSSSPRHRRTVNVIGRADFAEPLRLHLDQLNYKVVVAADLATTATGAESALATIVSESVDGFLDICARLPREGAKILASTDRSFASRRDAARAGVDAIIALPIDLDEVLDWLEQFESRRNGVPLSVLLIDDNALLATVYAEALESAGMKVEVIIDPSDAIRALDVAIPDLILMDVRMPGVDGIELARMIRQSRHYQVVPIIFVSGECSEARQLLARANGDDFIDKAIDLRKLVSVVGLRAERARALRLRIERDSLTGLLNHAHFKESADSELARCRRIGVPASVAMIDIDHFKVVNDSFGHPAGDRVIRTLARALVGRLRSVDIVGRYGGEEFGVLLVGTTPREARAVIDEVRNSFKGIVFDEAGHRFSVSFSAGLAGDDGGDLPSLIRRADDALYQAKLAGRDRVAIEA